MKISTKLYVSFGIVLLILVAFVIFAPLKMSSLSSKMDSIRSENVKKIVLLSDFKENQNVIARSLRNMFFTDDAKVVEKEWERVLGSRKNLGNLLQKLREQAKTEEEQKILDEIATLREKYIAGQNKVYELRKQNDLKSAGEYLMGDFRDIQNKNFGLVNDYFSRELKRIDEAVVSGKDSAASARNILLGFGLAGVILGLIFAAVISKGVSKPINKAVDASQKIARGNMNVDLDVKAKDETSLLMEAMRNMVSNIDSMVKDVKTLADAAVNGKLDIRVDSSKYEGDFKELIEGVNATLDAVIGPLNVAAEYIDRISKGDIPPTIVEEYKGDYNEIKNNLNQLINSMNNLVDESLNLSNSLIGGRLYERANASKFSGDFKKIMEGLNASVDTMVGYLDTLPSPVMIINKDFEVLYMNEAGASLDNKKGLELYKSRTKCFDHFRTKDCKTQNCACFKAIQTQSRAESETVAQPGNYVLDIAYTGLPIRNNSGEVVGAVELVIDQTVIKRAQRLAKKISDYQAKEAQKVKEYLNELARGNTNIEPKSEIGDEDTKEVKAVFDSIYDSISQLTFAINELINDTLTLANAATNGQLDVRADEKKHQGSFRKLTEGLNATLDAVIGPLNVAAEYIDRISKGDIPPLIVEEYKGDFNEIKNNLNLLINSIDRIVSDTLELGKALGEGRLDFRADSSKHQGKYKEIIETINTAIDNIAEPLQETGSVMDYMRDGDLTVRMLGEYAGELQRLKENINAMAEAISSVLLQISSSADVTASAAAEISAIAETLAASAAENSAQVDEIATAIEEMSRTISENAMGATRAAEVADKNKRIAMEGGSAVQQTVDKMSEIANVVKASAEKIEKLGESSKQIGEIISVIDEIADQTNLLALNAAIEAARAGEQGRGFAVVADEVRKLAERTTEATKQIANMIKGIQKETEEAVRAMQQGTNEVNSGIDLADKAGKALHEIVQSSQEVWDMINQIAAATEEQSSTAEQVAKNVSSISQVTSDTANRVQDIAKSAEDLAKQTDLLRTLLEKFKLRKEGGSSYLEGKDSRKLSGKGSRYLSSGEKQ